MEPTGSLARNPLFYAGLVLLIVVIGVAQLAAVIQLRSLSLKTSPQAYVTVSALINYGNGTSRWDNQTKAPTGWSFYDLTSSISHVEATYSPSLGEHYVIGIDGVRSSGRYYWTLWVYCQPDKAWAASQVGADLIKLTNGEILAWYYQAPASIEPSTWQPPVAKARSVTSCAA